MCVLPLSPGCGPISDLSLTLFCFLTVSAPLYLLDRLEPDINTPEFLSEISNFALIEKLSIHQDRVCMNYSTLKVLQSIQNGDIVSVSAHVYVKMQQC